MKNTKPVVDAAIRAEIFNDLLRYADTEGYTYHYEKVNDRQYGVIVTDANGDKRYVRVGVIVAALRDDMCAEEMMAAEITDYRTKQAAKIARAEERRQKAAKDKAKREAAEREKNEEGE